MSWYIFFEYSMSLSSGWTPSNVSFSCSITFFFSITLYALIFTFENELQMGWGVFHMLTIVHVKQRHLSDLHVSNFLLCFLRFCSIFHKQSEHLQAENKWPKWRSVPCSAALKCPFLCSCPGWTLTTHTLIHLSEEQSFFFGLKWTISVMGILNYMFIEKQ